MPSPRKNENGKKPEKKAGELGKYAGLATSLFAIMFVSFYIGNYIDKYLEFEKPYIGLLFIILAMVAYFYKLIKDLS